MYASPRKLAGLLNTVLPELRVFPRPQASAEGDSAPARGARAGHALRGADLPKPAAIGRAQVATATQGRAGTAHERAAGEPAGADGAAGGAHEPTQGVLRYLSRTHHTLCVTCHAPSPIMVCCALRVTQPGAYETAQGVLPHLSRILTIHGMFYVVLPVTQPGAHGTTQGVLCYSSHSCMVCECVTLCVAQSN